MCAALRGEEGQGGDRERSQRGPLKLEHKSISGGPRALWAVEPTLPLATPDVPFLPPPRRRGVSPGSLCLRRFSASTSVFLRTRGSRTEYRLRFNLYANECLVFTEPRADRLCFGHNFRVPMYNKRGGYSCSAVSLSTIARRTPSDRSISVKEY